MSHLHWRQVQVLRGGALPDGTPWHRPPGQVSNLLILPAALLAAFVFELTF